MVGRGSARRRHADRADRRRRSARPLGDPAGHSDRAWLGRAGSRSANSKSAGDPDAGATTTIRSMEESMTPKWLALVAATILLAPAVARAQDVVFLSTQLRPIEEAQKVRDVILKGAPKVTYVIEEPPQFAVRMKAEQEAGKRTVSLVGALHGELQPLVPMGALEPIDDVARQARRSRHPGEPDGRSASSAPTSSMYIPWMQATYVMVAHKQALAAPAGRRRRERAHLRAARRLGQDDPGEDRPAPPRLPGRAEGPDARFFQGYLYPSFTGGVVSDVPLGRGRGGLGRVQGALGDRQSRTPPTTTSCRSRCSPARSGSPGTTSRASRKRSPRSRTSSWSCPPPAGPKGRGYMPVIAGLAHREGRAEPGRRGRADRAPDQAGDAGR